MAFGPGNRPQLSLQPRGVEIASYTEYADAQRAVDHLADQEFGVEALTIVGMDLRRIERITGRRTYARVALQGALTGAWFGLFLGLMFLMLGGSKGGVMLGAAIGMGAGAGMLFQLVAYAATRRTRDFTSQTVILPARYAVLCLPETAERATALLAQLPPR